MEITSQIIPIWIWKILYLRDPENSTRKFSKLINTFRKMEGKIKVQNPVGFLCIAMNFLVKKWVDRISLVITSKKIPKTQPHSGSKDFCSGNFKMVSKEIEEDIRRQISHSHVPPVLISWKWPYYQRWFVSPNSTQRPGKTNHKVYMEGKRDLE